MRNIIVALLLVVAKLAAADPIPPGCPTCIANTAIPQNAQINIGTATIRGTLTVTTVTVTNLHVTELSVTSLVGNGSSLTALNASQLTSGTLPSARVAGAYTGITAVGTIATGLWNGTLIGTQYGGTGKNWIAVSTGSIPYFSGTGVMGTLSPGTPTFLLQTNGNAAPTWTGAPQILGTNILDIPLSSLLDGTLPSGIAVTDDSLSTISGAKISGNISGNAANITGTLALAKLASGTLPTTNAASSITATGVTAGTYGGPGLSAQIVIRGDGRVASATQYAIQGSSAANPTIDNNWTAPQTFKSSVTVLADIGTTKAYQISASTVLALSNSDATNINVGVDAGRANVGSNNTFLGYGSGYNNTSGSGNAFLGYFAGHANTTNDNNVYIGNQAGSNNVGEYNIFIGKGAGGLEEGGSNKLYIANSNTATPLIYGEFDNQKLNFEAAVQIGLGATKSSVTSAGSLLLASNAYITGTSSVNASGFFGNGSGLTNVTAGSVAAGNITGGPVSSSILPSTVAYYTAAVTGTSGTLTSNSSPSTNMGAGLHTFTFALDGNAVMTVNTAGWPTGGANIAAFVQAAIRTLDNSKFFLYPPGAAVTPGDFADPNSYLNFSMVYNGSNRYVMTSGITGSGSSVAGQFNGDADVALKLAEPGHGSVSGTRVDGVTGVSGALNIGSRNFQGIGTLYVSTSATSGVIGLSLSTGNIVTIGSTTFIGANVDAQAALGLGVLNIGRIGAGPVVNIGADGGTYGILGISNGGGFPFQVFGSFNDDLALGANGVETVRLKQGGNVGIGTTNPATKLDIAGGADASATLLTFRDNFGAWATMGYDTVDPEYPFKFLAAPTASLALGANATETVRIHAADGAVDMSGPRLFVGTTKAGAPSNIQSANGYLGVFKPDNGNGLNPAIEAWSPWDKVAIFRGYSFSGGDLTAPQATTAGLRAIFGLGGYDGAAITGTRAGMRVYADDTWAPGDTPTSIRWFNTPDGSGTLAEQMILTSDGRLGIGTTSPSYKLHVAGTAYIDGLTVNSSASLDTDVTIGGSLEFTNHGHISMPWTDSYIITASSIAASAFLGNGSALTGMPYAFGASTTTIIANANLNTSATTYAVISGGYGNIAYAEGCYIGGGADNVCGTAAPSGPYGFDGLGGGNGNTANSNGSGDAYVGGGYHNLASAGNAFVGGGAVNTASGASSTVGGGVSNTASGSAAAIAGGNTSTASGQESFVGGGFSAVAAGLRSVAVGGSAPQALADYSTVVGGRRNKATAAYTFAAGRRSSATAQGAFCWADSEDDDHDCNVVDQVNFRANGGLAVYSQAEAQLMLLDGSGNLNATSFVGSGASLTSLPANHKGEVKSKAQLDAITPALGDWYICSDCTVPYDICPATAATPSGFRATTYSAISTVVPGTLVPKGCGVGQ